MHFGCSLSMHGPPVAGIAHVDWCIISFDIHFGSSKPDSIPLNWAQFCDLLRQTNKDDNPVDPNDKITGQRIHAITASSGVVGGNDDQQAMIKSDEKAILLVDISTFSFRFSTLFPISEIDYADGDEMPVTGDPPPASPPIFMKPMHIMGSTEVLSTVSVTIDASSGPAKGDPGKFLYSKILKQVPSALWGACKSYVLPCKQRPCNNKIPSNRRPSPRSLQPKEWNSSHPPRSSHPNRTANNGHPIPCPGTHLLR